MRWMANHRSAALVPSGRTGWQFFCFPPSCTSLVLLSAGYPPPKKGKLLGSEPITQVTYLAMKKVSELFGALFASMNVCILSTVHTGVSTCVSAAKAKPESVMYYNNTEYGEDVPDQMQGRSPSKGVREDGRWQFSITSSLTCLGSMPASYSRSAPAAGEHGAKSCSSWQRSWGQNTWRAKPGQLAQGGSSRSDHHSSAADTEAVPVRKSCKQNQTLDTWNATSPCVVTVRGGRR